jgi:ribosomal protein S18 acetylase RimI-like enzyme
LEGQPSIRRAGASDAPLLAQVHVDSWRAAHRGLVPDSFLRDFTYERREKAWGQFLEEDVEETYLAEVEGRAAGILTVGAARDADLDVGPTGEIWGIYVAPAYWGRGIGRTLLQEGERLLLSRGNRDAVLWVLEGNAVARRFYEAAGYGPDGAVKSVELGVPLRAVRYRKTLGPDHPVASGRDDPA